MFEVGNLLFFKPFIFKNGAVPQNKFMLVLGQEANENMLLASLPTSKDHVPSDIPVVSGCLDLPDRQVNVFVFKNDECVIEQDETNTRAFAFNVDTFVYGGDLDTYPIESFQQQIENEESEVLLLGKINDSILKALSECLKNSKMVKNKFKRLL